MSGHYHTTSYEVLTILAGSLLHETQSTLENLMSPQVFRFRTPPRTGNPSPIRQPTPAGLPMHQSRSSDPSGNDPPSTPLRRHYRTNISPTTAALPLYRTHLPYAPHHHRQLGVPTPMGTQPNCTLVHSPRNCFTSNDYTSLYAHCLLVHKLVAPLPTTPPT